MTISPAAMSTPRITPAKRLLALALFAAAGGCAEQGGPSPDPDPVVVPPGDEQRELKASPIVATQRLVDWGTWGQETTTEHGTVIESGSLSLQIDALPTKPGDQTIVPRGRMSLQFVLHASVNDEYPAFTLVLANYAPVTVIARDGDAFTVATEDGTQVWVGPEAAYIVAVGDPAPWSAYQAAGGTLALGNLSENYANASHHEWRYEALAAETYDQLDVEPIHDNYIGDYKDITVGAINVGCVEAPRGCAMVISDVAEIIDVTETSITWEVFASDQAADTLRRSLLGDTFEAGIGVSGATKLACNQGACRVRWQTPR